MIAETITDLIGKTPLLKIPREVHKLPNIELYAKLELFNPFGSVKDRIAWNILKDELAGIAVRGEGLIENSSGNTAKAIAVLAGMKNVPFRLVSAMVRVQETKDILRLLGVELEEVAGALNCFDPSDPNDPQYLIQREVIASQGKLFFTSQFTNQKNPEAHYETTGQEILDDLKWVDFFSSGLGTSGSTLGIVNRLKEANPNLVSVGITASKSDFIPGIRTIDQMWEAGFFDKSAYNELVTVESREALDGMLELMKSCGLLCGPSSGANFFGTMRYLRKIAPTLDSTRTAVFIACDRLEWYLSYIRERRPELFGEKRSRHSIFNLTSEQILNAPSIPPREALAWMEKQNPLIVDIRSPVAFEMGSIANAVNLPIEHLEKIVESKVPFSGYERPVLFVCPVGDQSRRFAAQLTRVGGKGFSLEGGLVAWRGNGLALTE